MAKVLYQCPACKRTYDTEAAADACSSTPVSTAKYVVKHGTVYAVPESIVMCTQTPEVVVQHRWRPTVGHHVYKQRWNPREAHSSFETLTPRIATYMLHNIEQEISAAQDRIKNAQSRMRFLQQIKKEQAVQE